MPRMLVFWDGGGTLWNSLPLLYRSYAIVFRETIPQGIAERIGYHLEYGPGVCHRLRGLPGYSRPTRFGEALLACRWLAKTEAEIGGLIDNALRSPGTAQILAAKLAVDDATLVEWQSAFVRGILEFQNEKDPEHYPARVGAQSVACRLSDADVAFALVSNRDATSTLRILAKNGLQIWSALPDHFVDLGSVQKEDHGAVSILKGVAERIQVPLNRIAWVGDSVTDVVAALNLGAMPIGLLGGSSPQVDLERAGCQTLAASVDEAVEVVLALAARNP
jgi:phosphoglycolate phosphatase-like HAD superfamily hydrolase